MEEDGPARDRRCGSYYYSREYSLGIGVGVGTPTAGGCKKVELDIAIAAVMVCLR